MKHQINSFKVAFQGIWFAIKSESHIRFHLVASFYVIIFSFFYSLSKAQWAVVLLLMASVITAELFNTAIEALCALNTQSYDQIVKITKDVAAGAVLLLSVAAVVIAFIFYFDIAVIQSIIAFFLSRVELLVLLIISFVISALFVALGPMGIANLHYKFKRK